MEALSLGTNIIAADGVKLDKPADTFGYDPERDKFVWKLPPFGGGDESEYGGDDENYAIYNYDTTLADDGLYKLWRDGADGYYTVGIEYWPERHSSVWRVTFTCRANDSWDDLSDEC